jgi:hypothetical protein
VYLGIIHHLLEKKMDPAQGQTSLSASQIVGCYACFLHNKKETEKGREKKEALLV